MQLGTLDMSLLFGDVEDPDLDSVPFHFRLPAPDPDQKPDKSHRKTTYYKNLIIFLPQIYKKKIFRWDFFSFELIFSKLFGNQKKNSYNIDIFLFRSDPEQDPGPFFNEVDPMIQIRSHFKLKRIRNNTTKYVKYCQIC